MRYNRLFNPLKIGDFSLKNRTIFPPISTNFAKEDGHLSDKFIWHYVRRAKGGVALIIIENVCIDYPEGKHGAFEPRIDSYKFLPDWKNLVNKIHQYDVKVSIELTHPGYKEENVDFLSKNKIEKLIEKYVNSTRIAKDAGFDMVEIHGAHGLLINRFLSPLTNHRKDEWGKKEYFALQIRKRIKDECGKFPVSIRLAVDDFKDGGIDLNEGKRIANILAQAGYNMIQADIGLGPKEYRLEPMSYKEGWRAYLAEKIRPLPVPVAAIGVIRTPEIAEKILSNQADLVILGRTLIADPDWVNKVREGKESLIRKCIGCSECIKARHDENVSIRCGVNPEVGCDYKETIIGKASTPKTVMIIGAGPAGLEATKILSMRGHKVILYEKDSRIGGALNIASVAPGKSKIKWLVDYYSEILKTLSNVEVYLGQEVSKEEIIKKGPDFIIIATGLTIPIPNFINNKNKNVFKYTDILSGKVVLKNEDIVVGGAGIVGCETSLYLASIGNRVTVIRRRPDVAEGMETLSRNILLRELSDNKVKILTGRRVKRIENQDVVVQNYETGKEEKYKGKLVVSFGEKPNNAIAKGIDELKIPYRIIGDAKSVRKIVDAVSEGYMTAKEI